MKILLIESSGKKLTIGGVSKFEMIIKDIMLENRFLMDTETEFISRDISDIDDLLYEQSSSYLRKESALFFDTIDMIFINGDPMIIPWGKRTETLNVLLRMCIKTEKIVFASGLGFFCLVMLCATDLEKGYFNVVNGQGRGSKLAEITKEIRLRKVVEEQDVFLDSVTGDYYKYNYETKEWVPRGNMGIHHRMASQGGGVMGNLVTGVPTYKAKVQDTESLYRNHKDESIVYLRKNCIHHWAVNGCPNRFVVLNDSMFEVHPFNFRNGEKVFEVLAESDASPQVILFSKGSILATKFISDKNYRDTLTPLRNFIMKKLALIRVGQNRALSISVVDSTWYERGDFDERRFYEDQDHKIRHCGMTTTSKGLHYTENNAILRQSHKADIFDNKKRSASNKPLKLQSMEELFGASEKNFNRDFKKKLESGHFSSDPEKKQRSRAAFSISSKKTLRDQKTLPAADQQFEFNHPGIMKKKFYGNVKVCRSNGFDFDDGWVPGYRTSAVKLDPTAIEASEQSVVNEKNRYIKDLVERARQGLAADSPQGSPKKQPSRQPDLNGNLLLRLNTVPQEEAGPSSNEQTEAAKLDPNEYPRREVIVRKVAPQFFTKYKAHKQLQEEHKAGKFFYSQPYVPVRQVFR